MRANILVLALALAASGCGGPAVDLTQTLKVVDVSTGWRDEGVIEGDKNKLVPTAQFKPVTSADGLAPGQTSPPIVVKSNFGYKGTEPRAVILQNSHFVDAKVEIFAKYGSQQWKRIAEYPIERKLTER